MRHAQGRAMHRDAPCVGYGAPSGLGYSTGIRPVLDFVLSLGVCLWVLFNIKNNFLYLIFTKIIMKNKKLLLFLKYYTGNSTNHNHNAKL